jgi:hypothetical protein
MEQYIIQDQDLATADGVARVLHKKGTDVNELSKCVGFLRDLARDKRDGVLFFNYLDTVIAEGRAVVRSGRTLDYYPTPVASISNHTRTTPRQWLKF